jgi:hypothetical protein
MARATSFQQRLRPLGLALEHLTQPGERTVESASQLAPKRRSRRTRSTARICTLADRDFAASRTRQLTENQTAVRQRMQIEETFTDTKSHRGGFGLHHARGKTMVAGGAPFDRGLGIARVAVGRSLRESSRLVASPPSQLNGDAPCSPPSLPHRDSSPPAAEPAALRAPLHRRTRADGAEPRHTRRAKQQAPDSEWTRCHCLQSPAKTERRIPRRMQFRLEAGYAEQRAQTGEPSPHTPRSLSNSNGATSASRTRSTRAFLPPSGDETDDMRAAEHDPCRPSAPQKSTHSPPFRRSRPCTRHTYRHPSPPQAPAFAPSAGNSENFDSHCRKTATNGPLAHGCGRSPRRLSRPARVARRIR